MGSFIEKLLIVHIFAVISFIDNANSENYFKNNNVMKGLIFPTEIDAVVGEEVYIKLLEPVADQTQCFYRMTGDGDVDVSKPHATQ